MNLHEVHQLFAESEEENAPVHLMDARDGSWVPALDPHKNYYARVRFACELTEKVYRIESGGGYGGHDLVATGTQSWSTALVLAMTRPTLLESLRAAIRGHLRRRIFRGHCGMQQAILISATSCERCMNALLWAYGTPDGYPELSDEWRRSGTCCSFCRHMQDGGAH